MINRRIFPKLLEQLQVFPAVVLLGARQVGKTTLAMMLSDQLESIYLDLESQNDLNKLIESELYLEYHENKLVILDEIQQKPDLFQSIRGLIDKGRRKGLKNGRFLLLGSASGDLLRQSGESLAGRVAYLELSPFRLQEIGADQLNILWLRGGFPDSFLAEQDKQSFIWRQNIIRTYLERDIPAYGMRIPVETLSRFWMMLSHNQGQLLNVAQYARNLMVNSKTIVRYLDLLVDLFLVRRLIPWHSNLGKRLVKSPKIYIRDSGLLHALLNISSHDRLFGHPIIGNSWEGFVIENILNAIPVGTLVGFYRTAAGAEIDLILQLPSGQLWAIEIKLGTGAKAGRGYYIACEDLKPNRRFIVNAGIESYPVAHQVMVTGLSDFINIYLDKEKSVNPFAKQKGK